MTKNASKFLLPVGVSVLALIAFQTPSIAQVMNGPGPEMTVDAAMAAPDPETPVDDGMSALVPETPVDDGMSALVPETPVDDGMSALVPEMVMDDAALAPVLVMPEDADIPMVAEAPEVAGEGREISEDIDPAIAAEIRRLDAMGTLERQASMGEDILIIDREIKRAEAIQRLIGYLGVDGFKLHYPLIAGQLENSPIMLAADLERHKLLGEIEAAKAGPAEKTAPTPPRARDDGSSFFNGGDVPMPEAAVEPQAPAATLLGPDGKFSPEVARLLAEEIRKIAAENARIEEAAAAAEGRVRGLSLREVYGVGDSMSAIVMQDGEKIRVRVGDKLSGDTTVEAIDLNSITLLRNGSVVKIDLGA